jgi:hypothetical protein
MWADEEPFAQMWRPPRGMHPANGKGGAEKREGLSHAFVRRDLGEKTLPYED